MGPTSSTICVTGSSGQVGRALHACRPGLHPLTHRLDRSLDDLIQSLDALLPDSIVHAAAYTAVDRAESETEMADQVNHCAVDRLSQWCRQNNTTFIHYSTDYVFNGTKSCAYTEQDNCDPLNHYGYTKYRGELRFLYHNPPGCIFRTSWVLGKGKNFIHTILQLGLQKKSLSVIDDQIGRPTSASLLAEAALEVIDRDWRFHHLPKLIHLTDAGDPVSWYGLAVYVINRARDWQYPGLTSERIHPVTSRAYGQTVTRPQNSVLQCEQFDQLFQVTRPNWRTTVDNLVEEAAQRDW